MTRQVHDGHGTGQRDAADPWDAGVLYFFGFLAGLSAGLLICWALAVLT